MKRIMPVALLLAILNACSIRPEPINYGEDNCVHCQMTIMDHRYGTEAVTDKGKVYKFDSIECLMEFLDEKKDSPDNFSLYLFTPYDQPGRLTDATTCSVLHSKNLPSPMGMYLTAFETEPAALKFRDNFGGRLYDWEGLKQNFKILRVNGPAD